MNRRAMRLSAILAGVLVIVALRASLPGSLPAPFPGSYAQDGEALIHRVGVPNSFRLPVADIFAAAIYGRWRIPGRLLQAGYLLALAALLLAVEDLLGAGTLGAAAVAASACFGWSEPSYSLEAFSLYAMVVAGSLVRYARRPSRTSAFWLAASIGLSLMFRSTLALFPPALAAFLLISRRSQGVSLRIGDLCLLLLVPYAFTSPALALNWRFHHQIVPFENGGASCNIVTGAMGVVETVEGPWQALMRDQGDASNAGVLAWAAKEVGRHPFRYLVSYSLRVAHAVVWCSPLLLFALWALWWGRDRIGFQVLGVLVLYWIGVHCFMSVESNYFVPLLPILLVLSGSLLAHGLRADADLSRGFSSSVLTMGFVVLLGSSAYAAAMTLRAGTVPLEESIREHPGDWWVHAIRGEERLKRGDFYGAIADLSQALELKPYDSAAAFDLETRLAAAEMFVGHARMAWNLRPGDLTDPEAVALTRLDLARAYLWLSQRRPREAADALRAAWLRWEAICFLRGDSERADVLGLLRSPDYFVAKIGWILDEWPAPEKLALSSLLVSVYPDFTAAWVLQADYERQNRRPEDCREALSRAARLGPNPAQRLVMAEFTSGVLGFKCGAEDTDAGSARGDAEVHIERAQAAAALGDRASAFAELSRAAASDPGPKQSLRMAEVYNELGEFRLALARSEALAGSGGADAWIQAARAYAGLGERARADSCLVKARAEASEPRTLYQVALQYQQLKEYPTALALLRTLTQARPERADFLLARGICEYYIGAEAAAVSSVEESIKRDKRFLPAYLTLGYLYEGQRRYGLAARLYGSALAATADSPRDPVRLQVRQALQRLQSEGPFAERAER